METSYDERHNSQQGSKVSSEFRPTVANLPSLTYQALHRVNGTWSLRFISGNCRDLFECDASEVQADVCQLQNLIHPEDREHWEHCIQDAARNAQPWHWEGRTIVPSGQLKWLQIAAHPEPQPDGDVLWNGLLIDITGRKRMEMQLQSSNAVLKQQVDEHAQQLKQKTQELQDLRQLKDTFLRAISHDLRTTILGLLMVVKTLLKHPGETISLSRSILERMLKSSERQLSQLESLVRACNHDSATMLLQCEPIPLHLLIQSIVQDWEPFLAKHQATLTHSIDLHLPPVIADPTQLRRVFEHLLANAAIHNPPGIKLQLNATVESGMLRCTLQDNGVGISQINCDRIFERHTRCPQARYSPGNGLGLYLCKQIVVAHNGQIGVISTPGTGTTFWLTLPLATPIPLELIA